MVSYNPGVRERNSIDTVLRCLCPSIDRKYAKQRSILDYPGVVQYNYTSDSISWKLFASAPPEKCSDPDVQPSIQWPETNVVIQFNDCSCDNSLYKYTISIIITKVIKGVPTLIGQGSSSYYHEGGIIVNNHLPWYQVCRNGLSTDECYVEAETEFGSITFDKFKAEIISYDENIQLSTPVQDSTGIIENVNFLFDTNDSGLPEVECFYDDCNFVDLSYLLVDNQQIIRTATVTEDDLPGYDPLDTFGGNASLITPNFIREVFNFKPEDPFQPPYDVSNISVFEGFYTMYILFSSNNFRREWYNCDDIFNPNCEDVILLSPRPANCCCDIYLSIHLRISCNIDNCTDRIPGWYVDLSFLDVDITNFRFANPIQQSTFVLVGVLSTALATLFPGITVIYNPITDTISVSINEIQAELNIFLCPCPQGTYWNTKTNTCCPD